MSKIRKECTFRCRCNAQVRCHVRHGAGVPFLVQDENNVLLEPRVCVESVRDNVAVT